MDKIPVIAVLGPTASGKTELAAELAKQYDSEVISCDSMQIYKGMDIATAKPTPDEMRGIKHHLISVIHRGKTFSVAQYTKLAKEAIDEIRAKDKTVILAGGTGLYAHALLDNLEFIDNSYSETIRKDLEQRAAKQGMEPLIEELSRIDKRAALKLHPNNKVRIIRALEFYYSTGMTISQQAEMSKKNPTPYNPCMIGLDFRDRQKLYDRINQRVDLMISNGLADEVKEFAGEQALTSGQAIGYKELLPYLNGEITMDQAADKIKMETRRYAKRQLTWFRKDKRIKFIYIDEHEDFNSVLRAACKIIDESKILGLGVSGVDAE
ncbi:MAG: tRNA (adenosine(37)-N6)-dimethylallyltransferase MiaA [Oscillospiraceae bacterium]|jgi:tRNA dimethylallyltransferase|nr:tRNA (adenosine(37)-N6)-dimethylallyltransferase MiaA [Oscillospiraceae bacterium]